MKEAIIAVFLPAVALSLAASPMRLVAAPPEDFTSQPRSTTVSPKHTFRIEQYAREEPAGDWEWQTWIIPLANRSAAYPLPSLHDYPSNYGAEISISPNERFLFRTQKTGSGDNYGVLFIRGRSGRYELADTGTSFDTAAWHVFDRQMHFATDHWKCRYHEAIEFARWEPDGETFEVRLRGQHCFEDYYVRDWRMHYHLHSKKFFLTADERLHNRRSLTWKNWRRPPR